MLPPSAGEIDLVAIVAERAGADTLTISNTLHGLKIQHLARRRNRCTEGCGQLNSLLVMPARAGIQWPAARGRAPWDDIMMAGTA
jgi:hypothetical protein